MLAMVERVIDRRLPVRTGFAAAYAVVALLSLVGPAAAETPEQRRACTPDVFRLCAGEIPNRARIVNCLIRNHSRLSPACSAVFQPPGSYREGSRR
jgi:hypothetical protein